MLGTNRVVEGEEKSFYSAEFLLRREWGGIGKVVSVDFKGFVWPVIL